MVASARSLTLGRDEGLTKLLFDPATHRCWEAESSPQCGDLISEVALAIEMGADAQTSRSQCIPIRPVGDRRDGCEAFDAH